MPLSATFKRIFIKSQRMEIRARIDRFNDHHILWKDNRARRTRKLTTLCIKNRQTANIMRILQDAPGSRLPSRCKLSGWLRPWPPATSLDFDVRVADDRAAALLL